jgi:hypothetical protein
MWDRTVPRSARNSFLSTVDTERQCAQNRRTDETLLAETLGDCHAGVFRLGSMAGSRMRQLLRAMAATATAASVARGAPQFDLG